MGRGSVDWVLAGTNAADILMHSRSFQAVPVNAPIGAHVIGTLFDGTVTVIKALDSRIMDPDRIRFGYKGYMAGDVAMILAEFVPASFTDVFRLPF
jgi:hypothetical protein